MTLTKENCQVYEAESGNLYISHPLFKQQLRFYADVDELKDGFRKRIALREGDGFYAVLAKSELKKLDV